ncbi:MAG: MFS transporter [Steroidobacteraceae bacterium]
MVTEPSDSQITPYGQGACCRGWWRSHFSWSPWTPLFSTRRVPTIAAALHVVALSMKSVLSSYTLSLAVFIPISGWVADRFGTRRVFASAIGLFTLGSCLCGLSSDIHLLVACRILQRLRWGH